MTTIDSQIICSSYIYENECLQHKRSTYIDDSNVKRETRVSRKRNESIKKVYSIGQMDDGKRKS